MSKTKACIKCGEEKLITNEYFAPRKQSADGLRSECKECRNAYQREWKNKNKDRLDEKYGEHRKEYLKEYHQENKEHHNQQSKRYYKENKERLNKLSNINYHENRVHYTQLNRKWYAENREEALLKKHEYYKENKERRLEYNKKYSKANREILRIYENRRRASESNLPSTLTTEEWEGCKLYFNYECAYCGKKKKLQQEHFIPVSKGGGYTKCNILPACDKCNTNKRARYFEDWYKNKDIYDENKEQKIFDYLKLAKAK